MSELFENLFNLLVLLFLQAVLGFDNLLYISLESKRAPEESQSSVRRYGIIIAIALRLVLLIVMINLIGYLKESLFDIKTAWFEGHFTFSSLVFLLGGAFILYTAVKEINHMLSLDDLDHGAGDQTKQSAGQVIFLIVLMNLVFSFDSILSALAITDVEWVLGAAIVISGLGLLLLADRVSEFLKRNRKYEVLGLFILLIVGVVLLGEGGEKAHMSLFGVAVEPMSKSTFYFSIVVLVIVDILQSGYKRKLAAERERQAKVAQH